MNILDLMESHDTLQQIENLANMLIIGKEYAQARNYYLYMNRLSLNMKTKNAWTMDSTRQCMVSYSIVKEKLQKQNSIYGLQESS